MPIVSGGLGRAIGAAGRERQTGRDRDRQLLPQSQMLGGIEDRGTMLIPVALPITQIAEEAPAALAAPAAPAAPAKPPVIPLPDVDDPVAIARRRRGIAQRRGTGTILSDSQFLGG